MRSLPEKFTIGELIEQLLLIEKIEEGVRQAEERVISNNDVRLMFEKWSK